MSLPARLRAARHDAKGAELVSGLELDRLARLCRGHVSAIESGRNKNPSADTLRPIAEVLGISLDWLIRGIGPAPTERAVKKAVEAARRTAPTPEKVA